MIKHTHFHHASGNPLRQSRWPGGLHRVAWACAVLLAGCAGLQHTKGLVELKLDQVDEGIQSLEAAAQKDPRNAAYKIDHLLQRDKHVRDWLSQADDLRADGKLADAEVAYQRVLKLEPNNPRAQRGLAALPQDARHDKLLMQGEAFLEQGKIELALDRVSQVLEEHPQNRRAARLKDAAMDAKAKLDLTRTQERAARSVLDSAVTLQFREASLRVVFESLSKSTGINILFDKDVKQEAKATILVRDVSLADAIDLILLQNQLQKRVINGNTVMIYPATAAKEAEYEDLTIRSFQVTNADIKYLSAMLKSMLKLKDVAADERSGILVIRDTPERLRLAEKLIAVHDAADPEIMLEVEVLEVSSQRNSNLGLNPPSGLTISTPSAATAMTIGALKALKRDDLNVSALSATLNFKLEDSDAKLLASPRIRARNKEKAKIMIGDKVPTVTNTVTPTTTGAAVITGTVSYQDVGLKLEFEPQVYANSEVGIKISLEVSNIAQIFTDPQGGRSYQIGTRNANTNLRLKDGETQILGGLITDQDRNTASKIPGLGHLPVVGRLFGNNDGQDSRSEIILAITPRIVRNLAVHAPETRSIFSGTANVLRERPILAEPVTQLKISGTFGGGPSAAAPQGVPAGVRAVGFPNQVSPAGVSGEPGAVLLNPMPVPGAPGTAAPGSASYPNTPGLPPPPPMYVRPAPPSK